MGRNRVLWLRGLTVMLMMGNYGGKAQINRESFPKGFTFRHSLFCLPVRRSRGGATVWDTFSHQFGKIIDGSNADVAADQYHVYNDDVQLMKDTGMDAYRFSKAWSRIFPNGSGEINQAGVDHYNNLIDALLAKGIEPYVTLFHWDLPQDLEDQFKGWLDPQIIKEFANYAENCFQKFGNRVKHWITFNEPHTLAIQGYDVGLHAPGHCSIILHLFCRAGNSANEHYIFAHNMLLSHVTVAHIYWKKYKSNQGGQVGVASDVMWFEPGTNSTDDIEATQRAQDFQLGWFIEPLIFGKYPSSMVSRVGDGLPKFSASASALLKNSLDFFGINHYTTYYAYKNSTGIIGSLFHDALADSGAITLRKLASIPKTFKGSGAISSNHIPQASSIGLFRVPTGMRSLMNYIRTKYGNPPVIITENGMDDPNDALKPIKDALNDEKRIRYHNDYLTDLLAAIKEDGCNVKGYFVWSLLDSWEWAACYTSRFGLYFVDYKDKLKRYAKDSVQWFKKFLSP